jgi:hypothetical protein
MPVFFSLADVMLVSLLREPMLFFAGFHRRCSSPASHLRSLSGPLSPANVPASRSPGRESFMPRDAMPAYHEMHFSRFHLLNFRYDFLDITKSLIIGTKEPHAKVFGPLCHFLSDGFEGDHFGGQKPARDSN